MIKMSLEKFRVNSNQNKINSNANRFRTLESVLPGHSLDVLNMNQFSRVLFFVGPFWSPNHSDSHPGN